MLGALPIFLSFAAGAPGAAGTSSTAPEDDVIIVIEDDDPPPPPPEDEVIVVDPDAEDTPDRFDVRARVSTRFDSRFALDTSFDRANEQVAELLVGGRLELDVDVASSLSAYAAPSFSYVAALDREGDDRAILYFLTPEAWVRYTVGRLSLRVGSMTWAWGSSDFISPNDVLNPVDLRQSTLGISGGTKIPVVAAEAVGSVGPLTLRGVVAPFFTASRFHLTSWDFAVLSGRSFLSLPPDAVDAAFSPAYVDHGGDAVLLTDRPSQTLDHATLAGRATLNFGSVDLSVTGVHGWDSLPRIVLDEDLALVASRFAAANAAGEPPPLSDPDVLGALGRLQDKSEAGQTLFRGEVRRRTVVGFDASVALDPFVLKVDVAYSLSRTLYDQRFKPHALPWLNAVLGAEYYWGDELQVIVEAFGILVRDVPNNQRLAYLEAQEPPPSSTPDGTRSVFVPGVLGAVVYNALEGDLRFELGALGTARGDVAILPSITWRADDHHRVTLGGLALEGRSDGFGGAYTHNDQLYVAYGFAY